MKKKSLSLLLAVALMLSYALPSFAATTSDRLAVVKYVGIINGDQNGDLNLDKLVTRAEFVKMLVASSIYKDSVGDYSNVSVFSDVPYTHWAASYIKVAINNNWVSGYLDGSFRPNQKVTLEEGVTMLLNALGYTKDVLNGAYPSVQLLKYKELELDKNVNAARSVQLTRGECVTLFYNFLNTKNNEGKVYASLLDYELKEDGALNVDAMLNGDVEGPFVVTNSNRHSVIPFDVKTADIYKNNEKSSFKSLNAYDVVYYNETSKEVWIYTKKIYGTLTEVTPSIIKPETIKVGGKSYKLNSDFETSKLSEGYGIGDSVTLLIGDDGSAVDIVPVDDIDRIRYGMVLKTTMSTFMDENGQSKLAKFATVATTDGVVSDYLYTGDDYNDGDIVTVAIANGTITVKKSKKNKQSGLFDAGEMTIGGRKMAEDVEIMDLGKSGAYKILEPKDLDGEYLGVYDVVTVSYDTNGHINGVILNNTSGDLIAYGLYTDVEEHYQEVMQKDSSVRRVLVSKTYTFINEGKQFTVTTDADGYNLTDGGVGFVYDADGDLEKVEDLMQVKVDNITPTRIVSGTRSFDIADNVQVYYSDGDGKYTLVDKSVISEEKYKIVAYYDTGNRTRSAIRVIKLLDK